MKMLAIVKIAQAISRQLCYLKFANESGELVHRSKYDTCAIMLSYLLVFICCVRKLILGVFVRKFH